MSGYDEMYQCEDIEMMTYALYDNGMTGHGKSYRELIKRCKRLDNEGKEEWRARRINEFIDYEEKTAKQSESEGLGRVGRLSEPSLDYWRKLDKTQLYSAYSQLINNRKTGNNK